MKRTLFRTFLPLLGFVLLAAGCQPNLVIVKGKIVRAGEPIKEGKRNELVVIFLTYMENGKPPRNTFMARVRENNFEVIGTSGHGIPRGKYRVAVKLAGTSGHGDALKGAYSETNSPIIRTITGKEKELVIDLDHPAES